MKKLMAANWKMYKTMDEAARTARGLVESTSSALPGDREVLIIPSFTGLGPVAEVLRGQAGFLLGAQDFYPEKEGAFTGEVSPGMLLDAGCSFALAGHSERRHVIGESDALVGRKVASGLASGLRVILCVGETIEERRAGQVEAVLSRQLRAGLDGLPEGTAPERLVVAYEPVWAIGTGEVAGPDDIVQAHGFIRAELERMGGVTAAETRILYGGSVKPDNAGQIMSLDNVNGVLVGGASLQVESFSRIILA